MKPITTILMVTTIRTIVVFLHGIYIANNPLASDDLKKQSFETISSQFPAFMRFLNGIEKEAAKDLNVKMT